MARPATVLVVDDEPSIRLICRINLEVEGYRVLEAATVAEARAAVAGEPVDLMLVDLRLGAESGLALLAELSDASSTVPALLLTGSESEEVGSGRLAVGSLRKPFSLEELSSAVARAVGRL